MCLLKCRELRTLICDSAEMKYIVVKNIMQLRIWSDPVQTDILLSAGFMGGDRFPAGWTLTGFGTYPSSDRGALSPEAK